VVVLAAAEEEKAANGAIAEAVALPGEVGVPLLLPQRAGDREGTRVGDSSTRPSIGSPRPAGDEEGEVEIAAAVVSLPTVDAVDIITSRYPSTGVPVSRTVTSPPTSRDRRPSLNSSTRGSLSSSGTGSTSSG